MKIGLTYDLRETYLKQGFNLEQTAEFDSIETIDAISKALNQLDHEVLRIGSIKELVAALMKGERWDLVFNIAEGLYGYAREAQVPALLDAYRIPYTFSDAAILAIALDKSMAKHIVRDHGIATAPFTLIENLSQLEEQTLPLPAFVKPLAEGSGKGIGATSCLHDMATLKKACQQLLQTYQQPVLVEKFLPGREFTVGIFGNGDNAEIAGVMEIHFRQQAEGNIYSFHNKEDYEARIEYQLVSDHEAKQAADTALKAYKVLRCRDSARVDLRSNKQGVPQFLEINPIAGLHPIRSDLIILMKLAGFTYEDCIAKIISSAVTRLKTASHNQSSSLCA